VQDPRLLLSSELFGLSRTFDDDGRFSTRTHHEIPAKRRASILLEALDHRKCGRARKGLNVFGQPDPPSRGIVSSPQVFCIGEPRALAATRG
jgi:hypothetical protein